LEDGVKLYIESEDGTTIPNEEVQAFTNPNEEVSAYTKIYKLDGGKSLKVTAVPTLNSFNTSYDFKYWNDGVKIPTAPIFAKMAAHALAIKKANSKHIIPEYMYYIMGGVFLFLCCCCSAFLMYKRRAEKLAKA